MNYILGINSFHADSAATLIKDGTVIAAAEEERFNRMKHWAGFPCQSIAWCLKEAGISLKQVKHLAINCDPRANLKRKILTTLKNRPNPGFVYQRIKNKKERVNIIPQLNKYFNNDLFDGEIHFIEHHRAHLASTFYTSQFTKSVIASVDGFGDFASAAIGYGNNSNISISKKVFFPHSLGVFYTAITQFLGFPNYGDEYKVMGLAPYGIDKYADEMQELLKLNDDGTFKLNLKYFKHATEKLNHQWTNCIPFVDIHYSNLFHSLFGQPAIKGGEITQKQMDIAKSAQIMYEKAFYNLLISSYKKYDSKNLCLSGGCGANSVANGKIKLKTPFKNIFIQSATGDAGGALGAALTVWHNIQPNRCTPLLNSYLGPSYTNKEILEELDKNEIKKQILEENCRIYQIGDKEIQNENIFLQKIVKLITEGLVIGWFKGKMEWGPRALGNRSIIGDPRRKDMKKILNLKIKKRESFRPFAPSILRERVKDWFTIDGEVPNMMQVFPIIESKRNLIPAVTHVDGSGRLQTVNALQNKRYYALIKEFEKQTNIPMLLNTSFNENEPIVNSPSEAINCFLRTKMDVLVLEDILITRKHKLDF